MEELYKITFVVLVPAQTIEEAKRIREKVVEVMSGPPCQRAAIR